MYLTYLLIKEIFESISIESKHKQIDELELLKGQEDNIYWSSDEQKFKIIKSYE